MDDDVWRPTHLTSEQMEERRLAGATLLRQGRLSQAQIARKLGVSRASVCRWAATLAQEGPHGLEARPIPGRVPRLDEKAWARLGRLLDRDRGAMAAGFATERWTLKRIAALIEREFGVSYHPRYLERPLKAHGFSVQRPATRARERDELVIAVWPKREWVALKKRRSGNTARSFSGTKPATASAPGQARPGRGAA
jgi:transposase